MHQLQYFNQYLFTMNTSSHDVNEIKKEVCSIQKCRLIRQFPTRRRYRQIQNAFQLHRYTAYTAMPLSMKAFILAQIEIDFS